ncbi:MAG: hypothetical protein D6820_11710 [Lentisphaerae bacterium]|nr:MAG: hypothetical protein D6820_11710 [Lentisphaerota bacterium]
MARTSKNNEAQASSASKRGETRRKNREIREYLMSLNSTFLANFFKAFDDKSLSRIKKAVDQADAKRKLEQRKKILKQIEELQSQIEQIDKEIQASSEE